MNSIYSQKTQQYHILIRYIGIDEYVVLSHDNGGIWTASSITTAQRKAIECELKGNVEDIKIVRQVEAVITEVEPLASNFKYNKTSFKF